MYTYIMSFEPPKGHYKTFIITSKDDGIRPAGKPNECFYCQHKVGDTHEEGCVITWRDKTVKLIATVQFTQEVPEHYTWEDINYKFNEGTWCASNLVETFTDADCGCERTHVTRDVLDA